jgi:putative membrane protein insertion efficiency factor
MPERRFAAGLRRALVAAFSAPVHLYRYAISPMMPPRCRFLPTCSEYALESLRRHGPLAGGWLAVARVCRCHPFNPGGIDPVPDHYSLLRDGNRRWPAAMRGEPPAE